MKIRKISVVALGAFVAMGVVLSGCGGSGAVGQLAGRNRSVYWNEALIDSVSNSTIGPPANARAMAKVHSAIFEAWAAYDAVADGPRMGQALRRPANERTQENKEIAISYAAYRTLVNVFPGRASQLRQKMVDLGLNPDDNSTNLATPVGIGNRAAQEVINWFSTDGSNQVGGYADTSGYVPVNSPDVVTDPSRWQPLRFANGATPGYLVPHWGNNRGFSFSAPTEYPMDGPNPYGSTAYLNEAREILTQAGTLDDRKKVIAEYWANGPRTATPPGHWHIFGSWVSARDNHTLDQDVKMFFILGNAVNDSGIVCWYYKRLHDTSRPITAIRNLFAGQRVPGFNMTTRQVEFMDGSQWSPYQSPNFITPPFPEYSSGHSTFSAASAEVFRRFTGSDNFGFSVTIPARSLAFENNVPATNVNLTWSTFTQAAEEAGMSRIYGGIHFMSGNVEALECGREIGARVYTRAMTYINGTAVP